MRIDYLNYKLSITTYNQQIPQTNGNLGIDFLARGLIRVNISLRSSMVKA